MKVEGIMPKDLKTGFVQKVIGLRNEMLAFNIARADLVLTHDTGNHQYLILASLMLENNTVRIWLNSKALEAIISKAWLTQIKEMLAKASLGDKLRACLNKHITHEARVNQIIGELLEIINEDEKA